MPLRGLLEGQDDPGQIGRETLFDGWLKVHQVEVDLSRGGLETEVLHLNLLQRPGHDSTHVETIKA